MATILVVDDSGADRLLAGGLLQKNSDWSIFYAKDGRDALQQVELHVPDLVLTDINMPDLNGLELAEALKRDAPLLPVVLMTARGSEEIAVKALQQGAASYVAKNALARDLYETVERVLETSTEHRSYRFLMNHLSDIAFVLRNDLNLVSSVVSYLRRTMTDLNLFDEHDSLRIGSALDEALTNAFYHGNLEVSSDLRAKDHNLYHDLAKQRCSEPANRGSYEDQPRMRDVCGPGRGAGIRPGHPAGPDGSGIPRTPQRSWRAADADLYGRTALQRLWQRGHDDQIHQQRC